ncbi:MAG: hypothetical protein IH989_01285 [Planctomycetes bacterium]|nr:hypothetical protein [Planctomycetota bacterium]
MPRNRCDRVRRPKGAVVAAVAIGGMSVCPIITPAAPACASFHDVAIEQVIGGVDGDTSSQAIQLRIRFPTDNQFQYARLRAWDAAGQNPITIIDFNSATPNGALGDRVLIASENFHAHLDSPLASDFTMTNLIPASYLAAGRLTYENGDGTIYWSLSYGGSAYTGPTIGSMINDDDGDFGPPFDGPLPTSDTRGLLFQGSATDESTTNFDDYALTPGPAVFTNNAGQSAAVVPCPVAIDPIAGTDLKDFALLQNCLSEPPGVIATCCEAADINDDLTVDLDDYGFLFDDLIGP